MKIEQRRWNHETGWTVVARTAAIPDAQLVLVFGEVGDLHVEAVEKMVKRFYPEAQIRRCAAKGEVLGMPLGQGDILALAVRVELADVLGHCGTPSYWQAAVA